MTREYLAMKRTFVANGMSEKDAKAKAARIVRERKNKSVKYRGKTYHTSERLRAATERHRRASFKGGLVKSVEKRPVETTRARREIAVESLREPASMKKKKQKGY